MSDNDHDFDIDREPPYLPGHQKHNASYQELVDAIAYGKQKTIQSVLEDNPINKRYWEAYTNRIESEKDYRDNQMKNMYDRWNLKVEDECQ